MAKQLYKSKNSIHNAILLLLFVVGLFILYRYVKNVDTENKMLHTHVLELSEKVHLLNNINTKILKESNEEINVPKQNQVQNQEKMNQVELDQGELNEFLVQELNQVFEPYKHQTCTVEDVEDDDDESIKSIDITDMLKKVMGSNDEEDEKEEEEEEEEDDGELLDLEIDEIVEKVYEEEEARNSVQEARNSVQEVSTNIVEDVEDVEEDDEVVIVPKFSKEKLLKETNDSLREILKSKGLLTKGSKAELVERIIGSVH
jgi:hypothetical protein